MLGIRIYFIKDKKEELKNRPEIVLAGEVHPKIWVLPKFREIWRSSLVIFPIELYN